MIVRASCWNFFTRLLIHCWYLCIIHQRHSAALSVAKPFPLENKLGLIAAAHPGSGSHTLIW